MNEAVSIALIAVPGFSSGILPASLPALAAGLEQCDVTRRCYFLCNEFSAFIQRRYPQLAAVERSAADWEYSYHEVFLHDELSERYSRQADSLWKPPGCDPSADARSRLETDWRAREYCRVLVRFLTRKAREISAH